jgi:hypothetical protein
MDSPSSAAGIWKHWKLITFGLSVLFVTAVAVDVVLWYSLHKSNTAAQTLNDLIASQPPAPKTDEEKTALLDTFAAAHREAIAQLESQDPDRTIPDVYKPTPVPEGQTAPSPTDPVVQAKLKFMESMLQESQ